jgi:hypothetical protein
MIAETLLNPDDNTGEQELPFAPPDGITGWTEHYAFFAYDASTEAGLFIHMSRVPDEPVIWRGTLQIYLPDSELLVAKYFGRSGTKDGPGAGPLRITCEVPFRRFVAEFDGIAHRSTRQAITSGVMRDSPGELVRFKVAFEAAGPLQGKQAAMKNRVDGSFHTEQVGTSKGSITVAGKTLKISGLGVRDHSAGVRHYGKVVSHMWLHGLFPSGLSFSVFTYRTIGHPEHKAASIFRGDGSPVEYVEILEHPEYPDLAHTPDKFLSDPVLDPHYRRSHVVLKTSQGPLRIDFEPLHTHAITYVDPCEELNGTDFERPDGVQMCDAPAIINCNGERGTGLFERSGRVGVLKRAHG